MNVLCFVFIFSILCVGVQRCSEGSFGAASYPGSDLAVWRVGTSLYRHGLYLHPPQFPSGTNTHQQSHAVQMHSFFPPEEFNKTTEMDVLSRCTLILNKVVSLYPTVSSSLIYEVNIF